MFYESIVNFICIFIQTRMSSFYFHYSSFIHSFSHSLSLTLKFLLLFAHLFIIFLFVSYLSLKKSLYTNPRKIFNKECIYIECLHNSDKYKTNNNSNSSDCSQPIFIEDTNCFYNTMPLCVCVCVVVWSTCVLICVCVLIICSRFISFTTFCSRLKSSEFNEKKLATTFFVENSSTIVT